MKNEESDVRNYVIDLIMASNGDAIEAFAVTAILMALFGSLGIAKDIGVEIYLLLRIYMTVLFTSMIIRNMKSITKISIKIITYLIITIHIVGSVIVVVETILS